jgi:LysM repeat protein
MFVYVGLGVLAIILIWSIFFGSRDTSQRIADSQPAGETFREDEISSAFEGEEMLIEEDILTEPETGVTEETLIGEEIIPGPAGSESEETADQAETAELEEEEPEEPGTAVVETKEAVLEIPPVTHPTPRRERFHTVVKGDTLWKIGRAYGVTTRAIQDANSIRDPRYIQIGQKLRIP